MKSILLLVAMIALSPALCLGADDADTTFRVDEKKLGQLKFPMPENEADRLYLGLTGTGDFTVSRIKAKMVIIEIFSMYCPICQEEAPKVNTLYRLIRKDSLLKGKVKIIGVGTGNTPFEVEVFRKKYGIPFPVFPDDGFSMQKTSPDRIRTPTFLTVKIRQGKQPLVQQVHVGKLGDLRDVIKTLSTSLQGK